MTLALMGINLSAITIFLGSLSMIACRRNCLNILQKRFHKLKVPSLKESQLMVQPIVFLESRKMNE